jgi:hypothetical protein
MIDLRTFIKKCERDLILKRNYISEETLALVPSLSDEDQILCKPILDFVLRDSIEIDTKVIESLAEERILVCRLIPLMFYLNTSAPAWSSYLLTQAIQSATKINGIKLSEIGIAFLEILGEFDIPLNSVVYTLCIDISRKFTVHYRKRLHEFEPLVSWENPCYQDTASVAWLRYGLVPIRSYQPQFILKTMAALVQNEYFGECIQGITYLFEDTEYRQEFGECLANSKLPKTSKEVILSAITLR